MNKRIELEMSPTEFVKGRMVMRPQDNGDITSLLLLVPKDQSGTFTATWEAGSLVFTKAIASPAPASKPNQAPELQSDEEDDELDAVLSLDAGEQTGALQELAARRSVKWDKKASRDTMVSRIRGAVSAGRTSPASA